MDVVRWGFSLKLHCPGAWRERERFDADALAGRASLSGLEGQGIAS